VSVLVPAGCLHYARAGVGATLVLAWLLIPLQVSVDMLVLERILDLTFSLSLPFLLPLPPSSSFLWSSLSSQLSGSGAC